MRSFLVLILIGTLGFLVGCGSSGTPVGVVTSIALTPSSASLDAGQSVNITASVANDSSGKGVSWSLTGAGKLSNQTTTGATYTAPNPVTSIALPTVVATNSTNRLAKDIVIRGRIIILSSFKSKAARIILPQEN